MSFRRLTVRPTTALAGVASGAIAVDNGRGDNAQRFTAPGPAAVASTGVRASLTLTLTDNAPGLRATVRFPAR